MHGSQFAVAQLRRFECGDYFWYGERRGRGTFLVWGELVVLGSWGFDLPWCWQHNLPMSDVRTREERRLWGRVPETLEEALADE